MPTAGAVARASVAQQAFRKVSLDAIHLQWITSVVKIRNVAHRGLRRLIVSFLQDMEREEELRTVPGWRAHRLTGDRRETWSLAVTANWRLRFRIDREEMEIVDLDYEDYH